MVRKIGVQADPTVRCPKKSAQRTADFTRRRALDIEIGFGMEFGQGMLALDFDFLGVPTAQGPQAGCSKRRASYSSFGQFRHTEG